MKTLFCLFCFSALSLFSTDLSAQDADKKKSVENRSYAYGAMLAQGIGQIGLTKDEKNIDKFVEGLKVGLKGDSATFAEAQKIFQNRIRTKTAAATPEEAEKIAYNMGIAIIGGLAVEVDIPAADFDFKIFKKAFLAADAGKELTMDKSKMDSVLSAYFTPLSEVYNKKLEAKKMAQSAEAIKAGKEFMDKNGKREGVVTLPSGLQYEIIKKGEGTKPTIADKVKTHYHGTLIDGSVFDSSVDRGQPATFGVGQVIKGWQEGIPLMSPGAKYKFYIPQDLAYGMRSPSPKIPAGATLIFEVELIEVISAANSLSEPQIKPTAPAEQKGVKFLLENAEKEGIVSLPSGLQYKVLVEGKGPKPTTADKVKAHYHGTLIDGTVFDSSVERGTPFTAPVTGVIKGWIEGLQLMSVGAKYRFFIPQNLAYGMMERRGIPAGSALIFDVELLEINPQ
jgi:FKBP-type peptidyl-prolyl cis-trans isomerase